MSKASPKRRAQSVRPRKARSSGGRRSKLAVGKDIVRTASTRADVRVPINAADAARKERQIREKLQVIHLAEEAMSPHKKVIRDERKSIAKLVEDVEKNSEEREMEVYFLKDFKRQLVQTVLVQTDQVVAERTMTSEDTQADVEDEPVGGDDDGNETEEGSEP